MPSAELITIGTEILLGEILDTNAQFLARHLRDAGIDLYRKTTVGDNVQRIATIIREALNRCDIIITTGGLGPTVDDPTRAGVALALGVDLEYRPELWEQVVARFQRYGRRPTENNRRQAYIPCGALAVENPVGTAPAFIVEAGSKCVVALPGVPREMEYLFIHHTLVYLRQKYGLTGVIKTLVLHTAGVGESVIDDQIGDLETLSNPTVGLAAHSGQVDIRIAVKADSEEAANRLIAPVEADLRKRLGGCIYGVNQETLEEVTLDKLASKGLSVAIVEAGLNGELSRQLSASKTGFKGGQILAELPASEILLSITDAYRQQCQAQVGLGVVLYPGNDKQDVQWVILTPEKQQQFSRSYGGPPENAPRWALNNSLELLRNL